MTNEEFDCKLTKEEEDANLHRDSVRRMSWISLFTLLGSPITLAVCDYLHLYEALSAIEDLMPTIITAISAIIMTFFGSTAYMSGKISDNRTYKN